MTDERTQLVARTYVTGVEISTEQIARARTNVPATRFIQANLVDEVVQIHEPEGDATFRWVLARR